MVEGMPVFCSVVGIGSELVVIGGCDLVTCQLQSSIFIDGSTKITMLLFHFRPPWSTLTSLSQHQFTLASPPSSVAGTVDPTYYTMAGVDAVDSTNVQGEAPGAEQSQCRDWNRSKADRSETPGLSA
nr:F-box/kelch-repeat protein At1g80440-like [Ipomoea batatas]